MTPMAQKTSRRTGPIPARAGIGLRPDHYRDVVESRPDVGWFEVHTENYFGAGGPPHHYLEAVRRDYPVSFHGVGLSLGTEADLNHAHLTRLKNLADRYEPGLISEHLSWSIVGGVYLNDLLPLPYTEESLSVVRDHISKLQDFLGRQILIENPSTYLRFAESAIAEPEFLATLARQTGCGILLDVNNVFVSASNHGFDAAAYLDAIPTEMVHEVHLAGHHVNHYENKIIRIDDHGSTVSPDVWFLFERAVDRFGQIPTLIEWDTRIPPLSTLLGEARKAESILANGGAYGGIDGFPR